MSTEKSTVKSEVKLPTRKTSWYGWKRQLPDHRDLRYTAPTAVVTALPAKVDLRPNAPRTISNQLALGSCTANAIGAAFEFEQIKQHVNDYHPSRLFIYYNERVIEGTVDQDAGAELRDGMKAIAKQGAPPEADWAYNIDKYAQKPPAVAYTAGLKHLATQYLAVTQDAGQMKSSLAQGFPIVVGFTVYESFESDAVAKTGIVPMPGKREQVLGGHAVLLLGYDDNHQTWLLRNSWGSDWGMKGYFTMPYAYLLNANLADDFWSLRVVSA